MNMQQNELTPAQHPSILIIEDDRKIARVIQLELQHEGYQVELAHTGTEGLQKVNHSSWSLVLLDVMLPEWSGLEVLRRMRASDPHTPVILLTARDSVHDKVSGLDLGANDYITKPFQFEELLARIRACLRTAAAVHAITTASSPIDEHRTVLGDLIVQEKSREVTRGGQAIDLTPREYDLLLFLMKHPHQVMEREQILTRVWGYDYYGDTNVVDVYIRYLRNKVDRPFQTPYIHTIRGVGYMMKE